MLEFGGEQWKICEEIGVPMAKASFEALSICIKLLPLAPSCFIPVLEDVLNFLRTWKYNAVQSQGWR